MKNEYVFAIVNHPDETECFSVVVTPKSFWEEKKYLSDSVNEEIYELFSSLRLYELCDSVFEYSGHKTRDDLRKTLCSEGIFYSDSLEDWYNSLN